MPDLDRSDLDARDAQPPDLTVRLQHALRSRSAEITESTLRRPRLGARVERPAQRRRFVPALAAACVVVIVAGGLAGRAILDRAGHGQHEPVGTAAAYLGRQWRLVSLREGGKTVTVPASYGATVAFGDDGSLLMSDSVNALSGPFTVTADGFSTHSMSSTAVGYAGRDPVRLAVVRAIDAIAFRADGVDQPVPVRAAVSGAQLLLTAGGYPMAFALVGPAPVSHTAPATPTRPS